MQDKNRMSFNRKSGATELQGGGGKHAVSKLGTVNLKIAIKEREYANRGGI